MYCFFNLVGAIRQIGPLGVEVASVGAAKSLAARFLADLIREEPEAVSSNEGISLEVSDENGLVLFTITVFATDAPQSMVRG